MHLFSTRSLTHREHHAYTHTTLYIHSPGPWCVLRCPSAVALWTMYLKFRAGGQGSIIYWLSSAGRCPCIPSCLSFTSSFLHSPISNPSPNNTHSNAIDILHCDLMIFISAIYVRQRPHFAQGDNESRTVTDKFLFCLYWVKLLKCRTLMLNQHTTSQTQNR